MKQTLFALLVAATGACADRADDTIRTSQTSAPLTVLSQDCDVDAGYELDTYAPAAGTLQIVGVYEARNGDAPWWADPECNACLEDPACSSDLDAYSAVCDQEPKPHPGTVHVTSATTTLVLASYEPTNWTVTADASSALTRVILSSYGASTAVVPAGVTVETADLGFAYEWFTDEELALTCEEVEGPEYCEAIGDYWATERLNSSLLAKALVEQAEALSGDKLGAFHGCYSMSSIAFGAGQR